LELPLLSETGKPVRWRAGFSEIQRQLSAPVERTRRVNCARCALPRPHRRHDNQPSLNAPHTMIEESVRAFYRTWYKDMVTALPKIDKGRITEPPAWGSAGT